MDFCGICIFLSSYPYELGGGSAVQCVLTQLCLTLRDYGQQPARLLYPWDFSGENREGVCHFVLHGIFPTARIKPVYPSPKLQIDWQLWDIAPS